jgi:hypothetical protein
MRCLTVLAVHQIALDFDRAIITVVDNGVDEVHVIRGKTTLNRTELDAKQIFVSEVIAEYQKI